MYYRGGKAGGIVILAGCLTVEGAGLGCAEPRTALFEPMAREVVWPPPPELPRVRLVGMLDGSEDLGAGRSASEVFKAALRGPRPAIKFAGPHGVAVCGGRLLAVTDGGGSAVHILDLENRTHHKIAGWSEQFLDMPVGVAWAGTRLFVTDAGRHEVIEFDVTGNYVRRFGGDVLSRPVGITYVRQRDRLYVVDGGAHCLFVFDLTGKLDRRIGRRGTEEGEFNYPSHICSANDRLLVADSGSFRVQLLDLDGTCLRSIGRKGDGAGDFSLPKGVAFDREGHLYVVDAQFENVQVFNDQGRLLLAFGQEGDGPGEFSLPAGLAIDESDRIWVADSANRRIQVFDYLRASR